MYKWNTASSRTYLEPPLSPPSYMYYNRRREMKTIYIVLCIANFITGLGIAFSGQGTGTGNIAIAALCLAFIRIGELEERLDNDC